jgi:E3 ubiquitin-protein ligase UBR4
MLDNSLNSANMFSPLLLLKHSGFDKCVQDELLEKGWTNSLQLVPVLDLLLKLDAIVDKRAIGILSRAYWESMLHDFPFNLHSPNGILLSCVLSIRGIIYILDGLIRIKDARGNILLETELLEASQIHWK